ncbi:MULTISPECIES: siderophore-interacting protein [unclassified Shinella]|uniref:siderophore-interacting protein n=1 Tax=unclassified Shinella TaxID=2643062 RepID=UPI00225DA0ED|nr:MULTISPECIES: siderophore-interacting protein [unclassified Shinella]MCO5140163.1 siderophore-interacting protein [Shinella sp.]MDC7256819.1 siderophore-interacting protein [Shinella sp. YE25]CAI0339703.1 Siderophore-interacting protein [Rhizobiaceae bacterium]CAK7258095.1 Siderophore-interacting protein [Shinella sp. WSC3-e]
MTANAKALSGADHHDHDHYVEDYFLATATSVERLTPSMIRVVLDVEGGERLVPSGHPDEWLRLALPPDAETPVTLPVLMENGRWGRPDGSKHCPNRPYTIRRWDAATHEMVIDIVVHEGGVAAGWAMAAKAGDVVGLCNPEGRFWLPKGSRWLMMLTDITGLPAAGRVLEELPAGFRAIAHVEVPSEADRQEISTQADATIVWHATHGPRPDRPGYTDLPRIAAGIRSLPEGPGYIYIAGEAKAASACRAHFRDGLGFDKGRIDAIGYWIEGQARI